MRPSRAAPRKGPTPGLPPSRRARAYHEAGHAVMSVALGRDVVRLTIESRGRIGGASITAGELDPGHLLELAASVAGHAPPDRHAHLTEPDALEEVRIALAGPAAQARATSMPYDWTAGANDLRRVSDLLVFRLGTALTDVGPALLREMSATETALDAVWSKVEAVADALRVHGELDQGDIMRIIGEVAAMPAGVPGAV